LFTYSSQVYNTRLLTCRAIIALNKKIVKKSGGMIGIISSERIEEILSEMKKEESDLLLQASVLMCETITKQPFADGNRRTAYEAAKAFLNINGIDLITSDDEIEIVVDKILADMMNREELKEWFKRHVR